MKPRSWAKTAFALLRNSESRLADIVLKRKPETFSWDGTSLKDHLTPEDWKSLDGEITEQLEQKNDRGVAITCASMVEDRLRWTIEANLIPTLSEGKKNWLFTGTGPLHSFSAKTEIAFALGLIKEETRAEIRLIGTIRNKFAHNFRRVRFVDPEISALCARLGNFNDVQSLDDPMHIYGVSCMSCMLVLFVMGNALLAAKDRPPT